MWLSRINAVLRRTLNVLVVASIIGLATTMTAQVILRYLLESSIMGVEEMSTLFGLWLYFAGFALVSAHNRHIRGGFFSGLLSARAQTFLDRIFMILCVVICLYFLALSLEYTHFVIELDRRSTFLRWPTAIWVASLNLGLLLSVITLVVQALLADRRPRQ